MERTAMNAPSMCSEHANPAFINHLAHAELLSCRLTSLVDLIRLANDADTINPGSRDLLVSLLDDVSAKLHQRVSALAKVYDSQLADLDLRADDVDPEIDRRGRGINARGGNRAGEGTELRHRQ
jgi:hypothetical protein